MSSVLMKSIAIAFTLVSSIASAHEQSLSEMKLSAFSGSGAFLNPADGRQEILSTLQEIIDEAKHPAFEGIYLPEEQGLDQLRALLDRASVGTIDDDLPIIFHGLEGLSTIAALREYALGERVEMKGRIVDYGFTKVGNTQGSGHLSVQMQFDHYDTADVLYQREYLHWDIDVIKDESIDGYEVMERQGDAVSSPNDPFPGTVLFPPHATNPTDLRSVWFRGLDHKLYAKFNDIKVRNIYHKVTTAGSAPDNEYVRLDDNNILYQATPNSCIDLMFKGYPPAVEIPDIGFCLGRCAHPMLYNSK